MKFVFKLIIWLIVLHRVSAMEPNMVVTETGVDLGAYQLSDFLSLPINLEEEGYRKTSEQKREIVKGSEDPFNEDLNEEMKDEPPKLELKKDESTSPEYKIERKKTKKRKREDSGEEKRPEIEAQNAVERPISRNYGKVSETILPKNERNGHYNALNICQIWGTGDLEGNNVNDGDLPHHANYKLSCGRTAIILYEKNPKHKTYPHATCMIEESTRQTWKRPIEQSFPFGCTGFHYTFLYEPETDPHKPKCDTKGGIHCRCNFRCDTASDRAGYFYFFDKIGNLAYCKSQLTQQNPSEEGEIGKIGKIGKIDENIIKKFCEWILN